MPLEDHRMRTMDKPDAPAPACGRRRVVTRSRMSIPPARPTGGDFVVRASSASPRATTGQASLKYDVDRTYGHFPTSRPDHDATFVVLSRERWASPRRRDAEA
jgi:hypothetical protein